MVRTGCFSSVAAAQSGSVACRACVDRVDCFAAAKVALPSVVSAVQSKLAARKVDDDDRAEACERITRFFERSMKDPARVPDRKLKRASALSRKFFERGIDLAEILRGKNPFEPEDGTYYRSAAFILEGVPFKPKDLIERLQEYGDGRSTDVVRVEIARFTKALIDAGVLERKERNILCLLA